MDVEFVKHQFEDGYDGVVVKNKFKIGIRHIQVIYMWVCGVVFGAVRGSSVIAMLALTDQTRLNDTYIQIHEWDIKIQGTVLSSFFIGYALMLLPAELFLRKLGGKYVLTAALAASGALSVAMPTIINRGGWIAMCNAYLWMGMTQACLTPCNQALLVKWLPPNERNLFSFWVHSGTLVGIVIGLPISGVLSEARLGWELVFYAQAMLTLSMAAIWGLLTASSPEGHQAVGDAEKEYVRDSLKTYRERSLQVPWCSILKSLEFWGIACAHVASNAIFIFYITEVPRFLRVFSKSLREVSWQSIFPFFALWIFRMSTAPTINWICRVLYNSFRINVTYFRKLINILGACGVVTGLTILPSLIPDWPCLAVFVLSTTMGSIGFQFSGFLDNHKDMTENFSGTLTVVTSVVASAIGAMVPALTGAIIGEDSVPTVFQRYKIIFLLLASVYVGCNVIYTLLASSNRQYWDEVMPRNKFGYHNAMIDTNQVEMEELSNVKSNHVQNE